MGVPYTLGQGIIDSDKFIDSVVNLVKSNQIDWIKVDKEKYTLNTPAAFDIETSSFYENDEKRAIMYHWQFGIFNLVTTGRTWQQYIVFLNRLSQSIELDYNHRLCVYVHNLPYEWQFMRCYFDWSKIFLLEARKPVYAIAKSIGIEYKDSLILWGGKSLARVGEDLQRYKVKKMKGDLDYSLLRTPLTPLTPKELKYCENDIRVILAGIQEEIEDNGDISKIPLTNTQRVRLYTRKKCYKKFDNYRKLMNSLTLNVEEYIQLKRAFQGGFVHANPHWVKNSDIYDDSVFIGHTLKKVSSIDFASKYPSVMALRKFPMSKSIKIDRKLSRKEFESLLNTHCCLFDMKIGRFPNTNIGGVRPKFLHESMWSASKCHKGSLKGAIINNGRVYSCDEMKVTVTELDYKVLKMYYDWDYEEISNLRVYEKNYLPKDFVLAVLELYERKTKLKGIHEQLANYMIAKNMLNATYGMSVTDLFNEEWLYLDNEYKKLSELEKRSINEYVSIAIDTYNKNKNRFLFYPWGVWVTAWARYDILTAITHFKEDYVYSDTDSIKFFNYKKHKEFINKYNDNIIKEIHRVSEERDIPLNMFMPEKDCKKYPIGVFDYEGTYDLFKTQGAKRYMTCKYKTAHKWMHDKKGNLKKYRIKSIRIDKTKKKGMPISDRIYTKTAKKVYGIPEDVCLDNSGNEYSITLAGSSKIGTMEYLIKMHKVPDKIFEAFRSDMKVPANYSGRKTITYIDKPIHGIVKDYNGVEYEYKELSCIHMENSEYNMGISNEYSEFLASLQEEVIIEG